MKKLTIILTSILLNVSPVVSASDLPKGWHLSGSNPRGYNFVTDEHQGQPKPSGKLSSNENFRPDEFGTALQSFFPENYLGKRVKLSAKIKANKVTQWAGLWMRIDTELKRGIAFDNMSERPITGDVDWREYSVVLDVPSDSNNLSYGVLLSGSGQVWFDEFTFTIVDSSIAVTDMKGKNQSLQSPSNTDFKAQH